MCFNPKENLGHHCVQPIKAELVVWCGHGALSTLFCCCTRPHSPLKTLTNFVGVLTAFGNSRAFRRKPVVPTDVHGTLGGVYGCLRNPGAAMDRTSLRLRNGNIDRFCYAVADQNF